MSVWPQIACTGRRIGYARVSTRDQKLRMQREGLKAVSCDQIFEDHGVSGAKGSRPGLDAMLEVLEPGDSVVVFKLDRLGRSVLHLADLLVRFEAMGVHFVSLSEGINTTTPGGRMVFHIFSAVAEFSREVIVENTCAGLDAARAKGKRLGRPRKLSIEDVMAAHEAIARGRLTTNDIAERHDVHPRTVSRAVEQVSTEIKTRCSA
ncbi:MAG: recombinase family protein [Marivibrio sp.]|uniref:recombinase family protein n=1 Tax=Marivibrio sp. TaxID=2039719 RepID=UPI0032EDBA12